MKIIKQSAHSQKVVLHVEGEPDELEGLEVSLTNWGVVGEQAIDHFDQWHARITCQTQVTSILLES